MKLQIVFASTREGREGFPIANWVKERAQAHGSSGDRVIVRIVDRGPGIPPAQLERVFEPFYRAGTTTSGHRGSGLGLAIARGFTEANAGSLHVESLPGQGATFVFELPLEQSGGEPDFDGPPNVGAPDEDRAPVSSIGSSERRT